ncbi:heme-dependent catalase [Pseudovirgaria hyperparasitica]|uniref:Heme-dependent catalase n=1 Tax=Pseudovirgaria hyperparasitica TaxID=470096 RepID=A0A6A6WB01_9PEZI|nr:heme-dependent catalase [Pseudovirgaria hyperparasitica]KAF2760028.1 heme-dependent catalase [Pseudovirgaria hyperparasitica]
MSDKYIKWDAPGVEVVQPGEKEKIQEVSNQFQRMQMMNFNEHHHCLRGTHLKTQGCVMGKFYVNDNLPAHLAQGMFAKPGAYDVIMRYSSLTPKLVPDNIPAPRGIGMKIFGVEGEKIWGEDKHTQDWTMNNYPVLELRDPKTTNEIADSLERNWDDLPTFAKECAARPDAELACLPARLPRQHMFAMPEYSQSAYRFGDYVAKFGVFPLGEEQKKWEDKLIGENEPINIISQGLRDFHMKHKVTYSFCAQLLQNLDDQPVDDIGIEWDANKYPFEQLGYLEFEPQDSWLPEFRVWWDDRITVNSWHGLKVHQPLGGTNRMRRVVYAESRKLRLRVNGHKDYIEPASVNEVPAPVAPPQVPARQSAISTVEAAA